MSSSSLFFLHQQRRCTSSSSFFIFLRFKYKPSSSEPNTSWISETNMEWKFNPWFLPTRNLEPLKPLKLNIHTFPGVPDLLVPEFLPVFCAWREVEARISAYFLLKKLFFATSFSPHFPVAFQSFLLLFYHSLIPSFTLSIPLLLSFHPYIFFTPFTPIPFLSCSVLPPFVILTDLSDFIHLSLHTHLYNLRATHYTLHEYIPWSGVWGGATRERERERESHHRRRMVLIHTLPIR